MPELEAIPTRVKITRAFKKSPFGGFRGLQRNNPPLGEEDYDGYFLLMMNRGSCFPHTPPFILELLN